MSKIKKQEEVTKYANLDMHKFKFDFNLFVPNTNTIITTKKEKQEDL